MPEAWTCSPGECRSVARRPTVHVGYRVDTPAVPIENVVQSTARDVLARMILMLEEQNLPVVLHAHDEVVVEVPSSKGQEARSRLQSVMSAADPRCPGLPLACEAVMATRYEKDSSG